MEGRSPAQIYALVVGALLVVVGIAGFFYDAGFGSGDGNERDAVLGILEANGWHNVVHIATGAVGLFVAGSRAGARGYALGLGLLYLLLAMLNLVPVDTEDNIFHLLVGLAGLGASLSERRTARSRSPGTSSSPRA